MFPIFSWRCISANLTVSNGKTELLTGLPEAKQGYMSTEWVKKGSDVIEGTHFALAVGDAFDEHLRRPNLSTLFVAVLKNDDDGVLTQRHWFDPSAPASRRRPESIRNQSINPSSKLRTRTAREMSIHSTRFLALGAQRNKFWIVWLG